MGNLPEDQGYSGMSPPYAIIRIIEARSRSIPPNRPNIPRSKRTYEEQIPGIWNHLNQSLERGSETGIFYTKGISYTKSCTRFFTNETFKGRILPTFLFKVVEKKFRVISVIAHIGGIIGNFI